MSECTGLVLSQTLADTVKLPDTSDAEVKVRVIRSPLKLSTEGSSFDGSRKRLDVDVPPDRAGEVAAALRGIAGQLPEHPAVLCVAAADVVEGRLFLDGPHIAGEPLDEALKAYGPADIADALPRLARLADALDFAAAHAVCHGALTPADIVIAPEATFVSAIGVARALQELGIDLPRRAPYAAPEVMARGTISPAADQFSLAAIAYEWLFGRPVDPGPDASPTLPALPGVDADALARSFAKALAVDPRDRFASCSAYVRALEHAAGIAPAPAPSAVVPAIRGAETPRFWGAEVRPIDDFPIYPSEARRDRSASAGPLVADAPESPRRSYALVAALFAGGIALGALAVWMNARSSERRQTADVPEAGQPFTEAQVAPQPAPADPTVSVDPPVAAPPTAVRAAAPPARERDATPAAQVDAGLLIHSTPAGAAVVIDGVARGVTPVAVRGLALGTRSVVVSRAGFRASLRQVTLTPDRPSRTLEIGLVPVSMTSSQPAARETALVVDSRPAGATVSIDGRLVGLTPLTLTEIAPGSHSVRIEHVGYRPVLTTVDVAAGQRARVAVRLEGGQEQE